MKVERVVREELRFKPGEVVIIQMGCGGMRRVEIISIVENAGQTYVVLSNSTWRPISTYGKTWWKVETDA